MRLPLSAWLAVVVFVNNGLALPAPEDDNPNQFNGISTDGTCGSDPGFTCQGSQYGDCCSGFGFCGSDDDHCLNAQCDWGACPTATAQPTTTADPATTSCIIALITPSFCATIPTISDKPSCSSAAAACLSQSQQCLPSVDQAIEAEIEVDRGAEAKCGLLDKFCHNIGAACMAWGGSSRAGGMRN